MLVSVRLLPLTGKVIEDEIEVPVKERPTIHQLIEAAMPIVRTKMPMAGHCTFVNNLGYKDEYKKVAGFRDGDILTVMAIPLSVVMP